MLLNYSLLQHRNVLDLVENHLFPQFCIYSLAISQSLVQFALLELCNVCSFVRWLGTVFCLYRAKSACNTIHSCTCRCDFLGFIHIFLFHLKFLLLLFFFFFSASNSRFEHFNIETVHLIVMALFQVVLLFHALLSSLASSNLFAWCKYFVRNAQFTLRYHIHKPTSVLNALKHTERHWNRENFLNEFLFK